MINTCEICTKEFNVKPSREKKCHARFCSRKCFATKINKICQECGKKYEVQRWKKDSTKQCSKECHRLAQTKRIGYWTGKKRPNLDLPQFWKAGDRHPYWKGGVSRLDKESRHSYQYVVWHKQVFERDGDNCVICGSAMNLQADHIKSFRDFPNLRFDLNNGRVLCFDCHKKTPSYGFFPKKEGFYA